MSFGWSISDVILLAQYSWKVYESFAEGTSNATTEYDRFKREFRQAIFCLERIVNVSPDLTSLAGFDETFGDTIKFIDKHRVLTAKSASPLITSPSQATSRIKDYLGRFNQGYQTATWPIYREEAERLRQQLDRVVSLATLHATTTTLKSTQGIERQSEDIMRAVKVCLSRCIRSLSDKVNFLLKRIAPTSIAGTSGIDLDYLATLAHTSMAPPSSIDQLIAPLDWTNSPNDMLELLDQFSQKMEYLIMRDSGGVRSSDSRHRTTSDNTPVTPARINPVLQLLDSARSVANTALDDVGLHSLPHTQDQIRGRSASASLGARANDWDVFGQWLKWHLLHDNTNELAHSSHDVHPLTVVSACSSPGSTGGAVAVPRQQLTGQYRDISPSIVGSPLPEPVWTPSSEIFSTPGTTFTSSSSERRFSSLDLGSASSENNARSTSALWPVKILLENKRVFDASLEILVTATGVVEKIKSKTRDKKLTIYHVPQGGTNKLNTFIPWVDNGRVHKSNTNEARLQFKGSHQIIVKDERTHRSTIHNTRPVYYFDEPEDLRLVQEQLLGKTVIATFDVVRISTRAGQDHCASETLRVLDDSERQRSLLYYAHKMPSKSTTTNPGFVEWTCR
ncbi:hypothetical protein E4T38_09165 [Aureobasidium subglaciale]|nr:hypothetical protein E4T38_09165 [Aureobasidium subglaciale]KAI5214370.1 hypothetical protein E4T40_09047 [Aureobasidium subglaciale]KAI5216969.1 hypothetical protein E4T41_09049 [Aureobasidium subglaciale]KAI5253223.1 hypothetical protein E4T46_09667 [Aureobasidium subglaciale]